MLQKVQEWEGEFAFGEVFAEAFLCGILLGLVDARNGWMERYLVRRKVHIVITDLVISAQQSKKMHELWKRLGLCFDL
jgi:hypothetical protein